jgi:hypothetical protein
MVEVRTGQHHSGRVAGQGRRQLSRSWQSPQRSASARAPDLVVLVPPAPIPKMTDQAAVGSPAALTSALGATEADDGRELGPVDRVEPAMLATDRHRLCALLLRKAQNSTEHRHERVNLLGAKRRSYQQTFILRPVLLDGVTGLRRG